MKYDLSILIPARNEYFLAQTVDNILKNIRGNTEIIIYLDGQWADPPIKDHERVTIIFSNKSIGQRAATNQACRLSKAKYVMKVDAHCAFDEGFDVKLMEEMEDDMTMIPVMYNLHAFDWVCTKCGSRTYQGPSEKYGICDKCGSKREKEIIWKPRLSRRSEFYRFDKTLHFQYWGDYKKRPEANQNIAESMSIQGSIFMLTREKYWELDICDEGHGSWGQQGTEVACKTWLSGGRVVVNKKTWYAHMFRTQGGDFGFPYPLSGRDVEKARQYSRDLWLGNTWPKAKHDLNWLLNKFYPVPDWHDTKKQQIEVIGKASSEALEEESKRIKSKEIIYYTDNQLNLKIAHKVQKQLLKSNLPIFSVSLKPMTFGKNICLWIDRGYLTMAKQILAGLEASKADIIYLCEHDVLYHPSHFDFIPSKKDVYYYNTNVWRVRVQDGHSLYCDNLQQLSGLCGYRETLLHHFKERCNRLEKAYKLEEEGELNAGEYIRNMGFEPGTHNRPERIDDLKAESWQSQYPNLDLRHDNNLTPSRWSKDQFRNQKYTLGWKESSLSDIDGWDIKLSF